MQQSKNSTTELSQKTPQEELNQQRTPLQFPKAFINPKAKPGEMMTDEEQMRFLGTNPTKMKRLNLQIEYNKTTDQARKQELLQMMNNYDRKMKAWKDSQK